MNEVHGHDQSEVRMPRARIDVLGIGALLGADSGLVPISDLDAGGAWERDVEASTATRPDAGLPSACGTCSTRCATVEIARRRAEHCEMESKP